MAAPAPPVAGQEKPRRLQGQRRHRAAFAWRPRAARQWCCQLTPRAVEQPRKGVRHGVSARCVPRHRGRGDPAPVSCQPYLPACGQSPTHVKACDDEHQSLAAALRTYCSAPRRMRPRLPTAPAGLSAISPFLLRQTRASTDPLLSLLRSWGHGVATPAAWPHSALPPCSAIRVL